jgi:hypothetical protein
MNRRNFTASAAAATGVCPLLTLFTACNASLNHTPFDKTTVLSGSGTVATDPVAELDPPPASTLTDLPWRGQFMGLPIAAKAMNVFQMSSDSDSYGTLIQIRGTGTLDRVQYQVASNFNDQNIETSKSRYNGANPHGYPAIFPMGIRLFRLTDQFAVDGSAIWTQDYLYSNPDGTSKNSRVLVTWNPNISVTDGELLWLEHYNRAGDTSATYCAINALYNDQAPPFGASPPRRNDRFHGDYPYPTRGSVTGSVNSMLLGVATRISLSAGGTLVDGIGQIDATNSYLGLVVGGSTRVRQSWIYPLYHRASQVLVTARWQTSAAPPAALTMRITGPDVSTTTVNIPSSTFSYSGTFEPQIVELGTTLTFYSNTKYVVELYSPSSTTINGYRINSIRKYLNGIASPRTISPLETVSQSPLDRNSWGTTNGGMERSTDGGSSWSSFFSSNLPWALVLNEVAETAGELR